MLDTAPTYPKPLNRGDAVRVIAPSFSLGIISDEVRTIANERFRDELGLDVSYAERCEQIESFNRASIQARVEDIHEAFLDPELDASCPTACAGLRSEPRALGKVTLPKMFDRIYCDNPEAVTLQD